MRSKQEQAADWRDAAAYAPLLRADRVVFAWEWLRRDPSYRDAAACALEGGAGRDERPERWGLHAFENPGLAGPEARLLWTADCHPLVLSAVAAPAHASGDAFDLSRFAGLSTLIVERGGEGEARKNVRRDRQIIRGCEQ